MNQQASVQWRLTGTAALATFLTSLSITPTLSDGDWDVRMVAGIVIVATVGGACRQFALPRWTIPFAETLALCFALTLMFTREESVFGFVPGPAVANRFVHLLGDAFSITWNEAPPITVTTGVSLLVVGGVGAVAIAVDSLAVTWRHATLAGLPLFVLYLVPAAVLPEGVPWPLFALAAVGWILLQLADGRDRLSRWGKLIGTKSEATTGLHAVGGTGRRLGATALMAAIALPLVMPAIADGVFGAGGTDPDGTGPGGRGDLQLEQVVTVNPLANLRRDLVQGDDSVVLEYTTTDQSPEYIRIATLDAFDGLSWTQEEMAASPDKQAADGLPSPPGLTPEIPRQTVTTSMHVLALKTPRLPLPYPVTRVDIDGDWRWDPETFDVFTTAEDGSAQFLDYSADSLEISPTPLQLQAAADPGSALEHYLIVPPETQDVLGSLTQRVTAGKVTKYEQAVAIQNWFLTKFDYSTETDKGNGDSALESFINDRSGYCEQFAATMGLMARMAGIPSRLQVGFTPGTQLVDGAWQVTVHDAHAWPELWFEGIGWVRFEPTPGGGDGNVAPSWAPPPPPVSNNNNNGGNQAGNQHPNTNPTLRPPDDRRFGPSPVPNRGVETGTGTDAAVDESQTVWWPYALGCLLIAVLVGIAPLTAKRVRRSRRWAAAHDVHSATLAAWQDVIDTATDLDLDPLGTETPRDLAARIPKQGGLAVACATEFRSLAQAVERSRYAARPSLQASREPGSPKHGSPETGSPKHGSPEAGSPELETATLSAEPVGDAAETESQIRHWHQVSDRVTAGLRDAVAPRDRRRAVLWPASGRAAVVESWDLSVGRLERAWATLLDRLRRQTRRA